MKRQFSDTKPWTCRSPDQPCANARSESLGYSSFPRGALDSMGKLCYLPRALEEGYAAAERGHDTCGTFCTAPRCEQPISVSVMHCEAEILFSRSASGRSMVRCCDSPVECQL